MAKIDLITTPKYSRFLINFKIPFVKRTFDFRISLYKTPTEYTHGYTARTKQGRYVLLMDYDNLELEDIENELRFLIEKYLLPDFYLFKMPDRENSYHAFNPALFSLYDAFTLLKSTSCDQAFKRSPLHFKGKDWVLRFGEKGKRSAPEFLKIIKSSYDFFDVSTAHLLFIQKVFKVPEQSYKREDGIKETPIIKYNTANRV